MVQTDEYNDRKMKQIGDVWLSAFNITFGDGENVEESISRADVAASAYKKFLENGYRRNP